MIQKITFLMVSLILSVIVATTLLAQYQLKPLPIASQGWQAGNYQVCLLRQQGSQAPFMLAMSPHTGAGDLLVRTLAGKIVLQIPCKQGRDIALQSSVQVDNLWYCVDENKGLMQINLNNGNPQHSLLQQFKHENYYMLTEAQMQGKKVLVASGYGGFDVYELPSLKCTHSVVASETMKRSVTDEYCVHNGDGVLYRDKSDKLQYYSLANRRVMWSFATKPQEKTVFGIKFGVVDDGITYYTVNKTGSAVYLTTGFGCVYKLNTNTGEVIKKIENFRGQGNNAGLITVFSLADLNEDGAEDLIGTAIDYNIYALNGKDLSILWAYNTGAENQGGVSLYDITGDGVVDVVTVNAARKLIVIDGAKGKLLCEHQLEKEIKASQVILADIDGNGTLDFLVNRGPTTIDAFEMPTVKVPPFALLWNAVKW